MPVERRGYCAAFTSARATDLPVDEPVHPEKRCPELAPVDGSTTLSTIEFHSPHCVQRPVHLVEVPPQALHTYWVFVLAMGVSFEAHYSRSRLKSPGLKVRAYTASFSTLLLEPPWLTKSTWPTNKPSAG